MRTVCTLQEFPLRLEDCLAAYEAIHYLLRTQLRGAAQSCKEQQQSSEPKLSTDLT